MSKLEKQDKRMRSLLHIEGNPTDVESYIERLEDHSVETIVERADTVEEDDGAYVVLTVAYDDSVPSIAGILSDYNCFQPTTITVSQGYENWPVYHDEGVDSSEIGDHFREMGLSFDVQRDVSAVSLPESGLTVSGNETQGLTSRQFEVLATARRMGYYDDDVSVTMADIAEELDLSSATVCEHLNRAENHVISNAVDTVAPPDPAANGRSPRTVRDGSL